MTVLSHQVDEGDAVIDQQRWSGEWSGGDLVHADHPADSECPDRNAVSCPNLAIARAKQALAERQVVELSHRFVNQLQTIAIRLDRHKQKHGGLTEQGDLDTLATSILASGRLHRLLLPSGKHLTVDLGSLLLNMTAAIQEAIGLRCYVETESVSVSNEVAIHLAATVYELAWNAHKHAYAGREGGAIRVACRRDVDRRLLLSVADSGCGLPINFDPVISKGVGLMLVCATVTNFGGNLQIQSDQGTCFTLRLNIPCF